MEISETEEQSMIREMVRGFAEEVLAPTCLQRDKGQEAPLDEWRAFCELGLQGITIAEQYGGSPVDDVTEAIIVEELARVDPSFSVMFCVHVGLCSKTISLHGNEEQKREYLSRLAGNEIGAYSLSEAGAGTDAASMNCRAQLSDDGTHYILNGEKMWVTNGESANIYVLFAKDIDHPEYGQKKHGGTTAFIVEGGFDGFSVGKKEDKLGIRSSDTCSLLLENCKVPVANVLKESGRGFPIAMNALDNSRIGIAAQALGIAQGAFESALKYAHERETFGKPIAHHQGIGNYLADMATRVEAARLMVYKAAWAKRQHYEHGAPRHTKEASMAKLFAGDTAMWVAERAVQVLGGYGYTTDFPVERFFRDAKITQIYEGTQEVQRIVISRSIAPK
ncbi:MAG: acyl-CoA dehydrogenase family protein [Candidatus Thalassarchaeaceae archaeon]|jgi:alkylation response protein AidB-like acyl-CoA dehydrogenase|nr:acyl-CoA dehydrogenase [Euryarchaeota archaeon]MDP7091451.1 acyl-CoA dehydrogenase family protein [Candidatus Thalassarchaeaceae archaeon]MDP7257252.1 acyl-CoA dehydrogenase family protein [Candidatus Thalassarchaeaceae archaeon]MDP7446568.1 acyl-CoA dehydrogenase family protein [Candidatus Thalassarchaeaceae archaeon]MDP7648591.1 acyl-CoA dehydrogenase family protein [Candidatus Thalassarchaeaceae archaeon]|tara:strand:- start:10136 stop:11311 length:1176 start_codon:yes stop_codon:yes gene_type:complete